MLNIINLQSSAHTKYNTATSAEQPGLAPVMFADDRSSETALGSSETALGSSETASAHGYMEPACKKRPCPPDNLETQSLRLGMGMFRACKPETQLSEALLKKALRSKCRHGGRGRLLGRRVYPSEESTRNRILAAVYPQSMV